MVGNEIKKVFWATVPGSSCNLDCSYCYVKHTTGKNVPGKFRYETDYMLKALSKKRLGGNAFVNLVGDGETLLWSGSIDLIEGFLKDGHVVQLVSNATLTSKINKLLELPEEYRKRLIFFNSFHYLEYLRLNILDEVVDNLLRMKESGISILMSLVVSEDLLPHIDDVQKLYNDKFAGVSFSYGAELDPANDWQISAFYTEDVSKLVTEKLANLKDNNFTKQNDKKATINYGKVEDFCFAGAWSFVLNLGDGNYNNCFNGKRVQNIFKDINKPIKFKPIGKCPSPYCVCGDILQSFGITPDSHYPLNFTETWLGSDIYPDEIREQLRTNLSDTNRLRLTDLYRIAKFKIKSKKEKFFSSKE